LEERLRVAQRPNGCRKARGKDTFERGDGEARPIPSKARIRRAQAPHALKARRRPLAQAKNLDLPLSLLRN
jgi:hypothetical protein